MRVISFNANGIRAAARKGFFDWLQEQKADFVCIQETKAQLEQLKDDPVFFPKGFYCEYVDALKKGYSGVAIFAKTQPEKSVRGFDLNHCPDEGRYLQFDYPEFSIVSIYLPSGTSGEERQTIKFKFLDCFEQHLIQLKDSGRAFILCGDYNIAHKQIDLKNWRSNQKHSGFLPEERAWMDKLFGSLGFIDAFRLLNTEPDQYTWWSSRGRAREKNVGWRIDYQVVTPNLMTSVKSVEVFREVPFSDHAPLIIEYEGDWCV